MLKAVVDKLVRWYFERPLFNEIKQTTQFMGNLPTSRNEMANSYTSLKASILLRKV
jgi:hypothetical protein